MKRKAAITLLSMLLMAALWMTALCGCGSESAANTIGPWDTQDQQTKAAIELLATGGFSAFAGFEVDGTYQSAKMGIEYYKDGKLVKDEGQGSIALGETSEGIAGFSCKDGTATIGVSVDGSTSCVSDIQLSGYPKDGDNILFVPLSESKDIADGQKVYLGILNTGSDGLDTAVLDASYDKSKLKGKNWLFYVEFSTEPLE